MTQQFEVNQEDSRWKKQLGEVYRTLDDLRVLMNAAMFPDIPYTTDDLSNAKAAYREVQRSVEDAFRVINIAQEFVTSDETSMDSLRNIEAATPEPPPIPNDETPIYHLVIQDIESRAEAGKEKYGTYLQPHNGRDALMDAYQESIDQTIYLRQKLEEEKE